MHLPESHESFDDWHLRVPFEREEVKMLCCSEDVACLRNDVAAHPETECCEASVAPVCEECAKHLDAEDPALPPASLSDDMMIDYAPTLLYAKTVTVMEMICASVCATSMMFVLFWKINIGIAEVWMKKCRPTLLAWQPKVTLPPFLCLGKIC